MMTSRHFSTLWFPVSSACILILGIASTGTCQTVENASATAVPDVNYAQLATPETAAALGLSDEQKATITTLIQAGDAALASANEADKAGIQAENNSKLASVLNDDQRRLFASLFTNKTLRFNFR